MKIADEIKTDESDDWYHGWLEPEDLSTGISKCHFLLIDEIGNKTPMYFLAGFPGFIEDEEYIKPVISWAVSTQPPIKEPVKEEADDDY